ncbi:coiled-coil domain-containing protein 50-like [Python bivittatus]|uniref:Coiled-coil domain-containing protein 50-like n=1 Tax=Python bivittatus TaxID=176946 RepID=A0A9F5MXG9_PYTBI|nr:coiled-coil domain-containing protein 50-like [Python bivittatus]
MTEVQIDSSCLPPVQEVCRDFAVLEDSALAYCLQEQEIELHYASNIQKNQLVQNDLRIAKRLQDQEVEAQKLQVSRRQKETKERDPENAQAIQKGLQKKMGKDYRKKAKDQPWFRGVLGSMGKSKKAATVVQVKPYLFFYVRQGKEDIVFAVMLSPRQSEKTSFWSCCPQVERVKRFQNLEKDESRQQRQRPRPSHGTRDGATEPLHWEMARLELQTQQQFQEDEELARKLQEEEEQEQTRIRARRNREQDNDYRAAQVAQDEEIARYLQDKELHTQWGSPRQDRQQAQPPGLPEGQYSSSPEKESWQSSRTPPLLRIQTQENTNVTVRGSSTEKKPPFCRNIAEVLDPTFQAAKMGTPSDVMDLGSQASSPGPLAQMDSSFDYPQGVAAPVFVSPTKRQPEKVGCPKSSNKKEGCRQQ